MNWILNIRLTSLSKSWWLDQIVTQIQQQAVCWMEWRDTEDPDWQNKHKFAAYI